MDLPRTLHLYPKPPLAGIKIQTKCVTELNRYTNFPESTRHIVIKKNEQNAVRSMMNWRLRHGVYKSKEEALANYNDILLSYRCYYKFWGNRAMSESDRVQIVVYEELIKDPTVLIRSLQALGAKGRSFEQQHTFQFNKLPNSRKNRPAPVSTADIVQWLDRQRG